MNALKKKSPFCHIWVADQDSMIASIFHKQIICWNIEMCLIFLYILLHKRDAFSLKNLIIDQTEQQKASRIWKVNE